MSPLERLYRERYEHGLRTAAAARHMTSLPGVGHLNEYKREQERIDVAIEEEKAAEAQREAVRRFIPR